MLLLSGKRSFARLFAVHISFNKHHSFRWWQYVIVGKDARGHFWASSTVRMNFGKDQLHKVSDSWPLSHSHTHEHTRLRPLTHTHVFAHSRPLTCTYPHECEWGDRVLSWMWRQNRVWCLVHRTVRTLREPIMDCMLTEFYRTDIYYY